MRLSTIFAGAVLSGVALLGVAAPAFASTTNPTPPPTPSFTFTQGNDHNQGGNDNNWNQGDKGNKDPKGCSQDNWNSRGDNNWNQGRDDNGRNDGCQADNCRWSRTFLPWGNQCDSQCHFPQLTAWQGGNRFEGSNWFEGNQWNSCEHHGHKPPRNHCTTQFVFFNFPHGSLLFETQGPWLHVNEILFHQGQSWTVTNVHHTLVGHDVFTVSDSSSHPVINTGLPIWHDFASVVTCTTRF